ncbi:MAG: divalent-cation tolerance protein CutA [Smithellaceae bacterium]|nr:divalent-cation tolerance protein CutA [Smithellaceae bacterium]
MTGYLQVMTTTPSREVAEAIAQALTEKKLAGCVQIVGPIKSVYRWEGRIEESSEWLCLVKTNRDLYSACEEAIKAIHPYEVPEIIALPVTAGSRDYLSWLAGELAPPALQT